MKTLISNYVKIRIIHTPSEKSVQTKKMVQVQKMKMSNSTMYTHIRKSIMTDCLTRVMRNQITKRTILKMTVSIHEKALVKTQLLFSRRVRICLPNTMTRMEILLLIFKISIMIARSMSLIL